ncbi:helix-turn-helix domain-containing protein [Neisseria chenwenguii]|uniref:helix-turn-helix domain-containing protein n=1 Tax=Neisseria chenwenguii TaxID=1853278 RepID=UPI000F4D8DDE|nr:helix-turn-helix domain-containing protein [Neisseria chenwenguii]ROV56601.1 helix-turn-helix domain-containing protein [Neisseria chenwenguii]
MEHIGDRIKEARLKLGLSQSALAKRADVSQGTIGQLESGRNQSSGKIVELATALNVSPEWLLYGKNPPSIFSKPTNVDNLDLFITSNDTNAALKKEFLKQNSFDTDYIDFIKCKDESMSPTISIFDDVAFNRLDRIKHENGVFVIKRSSGLIFIRRTILDSSQKWIYRCDNLDKTRFSDVDAIESDEILGRVIWRGGINSFNL